MISSHTDLTVCNLGLNLLGELEIITFEENTDLGAICSRLYPAKRDAVLSMHDWNFGRKKRMLALSSDKVPLNTYKNAFVLPSDMLHGPEVVFGDGNHTTGFDIFDQYLFTNHSEIIIDYRRRVLEEYWPPSVISLIAEAFASDAARPITGHSSKAKEHRERAFGLPSENMQGGLFGIAKLLDAQSQPIEAFSDYACPLTGVRWYANDSLRSNRFY